MKINHLSRLIAFGGSVLLSGQIGFGQINTPTGAAKPFNSNASYQYGIMPTNLPTSGTYGKSSDAGTAYTEWKTRFVRDCSGGSMRVLFDDNSSTVSEGIAYGMLLSAYAADKAVFDGLWKFYKDNSNSNGVMNWKLSGCTGNAGQNGATDAELDAAMALLIAEEQWPSINSPYDYKNEASTLISKIRQFEIHPSTYQTINGDAWGFNNNCRNPSYFSPAYYREYAKVETSQSTFWTNTVNASNTFLLTNRNSTTGLVSNWADQNAAANGCNGPTEYGWDACRNPWRMANDVLWNGANSATTASDICTKMAAWSSGYHNNLKGPLPQNASNPSVGQYKNGTFSTYALAIMGTSATHQQHLNNSYTAVVGLGNSEPYFSATLRAVSLFMLTGNFWKPGSVSTTPGNQNPTVSLTSPVNNTSICFGTAISLTATASDPDGTISKVEFYNGTTLLGTTSSTSPYTYLWTPTNSGTASITAKAYDNATTAATATSTAASVLIVALPTAPSGTNPADFCEGGNSPVWNATASSGNTLQWYTTATGGAASGTAPTISNTPTGTRSVWVSQKTNNGGCEGPRLQLTTNVNAKTVITKQPKDTTVCLGSTLNLVVSATGSGTFTYQWKQYGNNVGSNSRIFTKQSIGYNDAGSYTVDVTNSCGTITSNAVNVSISTSETPAVTLNTSLSAACGDGTKTVLLTANPTNGGNAPQYTFKAGSATIGTSNQTANTFTYTIPANTGTSVQNLSFTVDLKSSSNCITVGANNPVTSTPVTVQIDPQVTAVIANIVESKATICVATRTLTSATLPANYSATWSTNAGGANVSAGQLSGIAEGQSTLTTYKVESILKLCPAKSDTVTTRRASLPAKPVMTNSVGACNTKRTGIGFSVINNVGSTFDWSVTGGVVASGQGTSNILVDFNSGVTNATVSVVETNAQKCPSAGTSLNVKIDVCTGVEEDQLNASNVKLYPNPFENSFTVDFGGFYSQISKIELCNLEGKVMEVKQASEITSEIQLGDNVGAGQYFVRIITSNNVITKPLIKIK